MAFGRLERTKGSEPMSDINVTPLVDEMLVLLVIFIITAPLLAIDAQGAIFLDNQPQTLQALAAALAPVAAQDAQTEVQLRADTAVPYGRVVEVMGVVQQAGLSRIAFVADPQPTAKP